MNTEELKKLIVDDTTYETQYTVTFNKRKPYVPKDRNNVLAIIPGNVYSILVKKGDLVKSGQIILTVEAMKMQNNIAAPFDGKVKQIHVKPGQQVHKDDLLLELE